MRAAFSVIVVMLLVAPAAAAEMPARKAGLWQLTMTVDKGGMPPQVIKQCIDAATDKKMNSVSGGVGREQCPKQDIRRVGDTIVVDSVCKTGPMTTTSHAVASGDFNSAYTVQIDSKVEGGPQIPGMPSGNTKMTLAAKWLGPCEAGQRPGDMIMANGFKMNVDDMPQMPMGPGAAPPAAPRR
jgi:hypothetical protein